MNIHNLILEYTLVYPGKIVSMVGPVRIWLLWILLFILILISY